MTTGQRIKLARKEAGLTQKALGEKCNMPDSQIRQYELGMVNPKKEQLQRIANALSIPLIELLDSACEEKNTAFVNKFFAGSITPDNITESQLEEMISAAAENRALFDSLVTEKEKWAIQKITEYLRKLSPSGQEEAVNRVEELTHLARYQIPHSPNP